MSAGAALTGSSVLLAAITAAGLFVTSDAYRRVSENLILAEDYEREALRQRAFGKPATTGLISGIAEQRREILYTLCGETHPSFLSCVVRRVISDRMYPSRTQPAQMDGINLK